MITEPEGFVRWTWKNQSSGYIISVSPKQKRKIEDAFKLKSAHEGQFKRKMNHIGQLDAPISDKNYMYPIDAGYYECYIFGQNCDLRLAFDWGKSAEGTVVIVILALTDHRGKIFVNNGYECRLISPMQYAEYVQIGYKKGLLKKKN